MPRILTAAFFIAVITLVGSCSKDAAKKDEAILYGTWVNPDHGDTLRFYKKGTRNIMSSNQSFNPLLYTPMEQEFKYENDKLYLNHGLGIPDFYQVDGFKWKTRGRRFELLGFRVYLFMSSSTTVFNYIKIS